MSQQTIQIADKPTLDDVKALLENSGYGLEALKNSLGSGGGGGNGGGVACQFSIKENSVVVNQDEVISTLPYDFSYGSAVVFNNEIHILGGGNNNHYKWDGGTWSTSWHSVSTLPYDFKYGSAVVLNDEIHILGGGGTPKKHYKWNGTSWTSVSTLPYNFAYGSAVVFNNEIHILGGSSGGGGTEHYRLKRIANLITLYLQSGNKIICDTEKTGPISDNLKKVDFGYECIKTGLCKMYDMNVNTNNIIFTII